METLAHFFVPRVSNNHKAKLLHSSSLLLIVFGIIAFQLVLQITSHKNGQVLGYAANISPSEVERLTNVQREQNGLDDLTDNPELDAGALAKGQNMLKEQYWAHVAPDGTQPWAFFIAQGYNYRYAGENLARDFPDAQSAVTAWMNSPTHRENMLSPNYKDIGIGVVEGNLAGVDTTIIVQFFGTKLGDVLPVQPVAAATLMPSPVASATPKAVIAAVIPTPTETPIPTSSPVVSQKVIVASSKVTPFDLTKVLSLGLVGALILVVAVDGFLINRRKIFRIAGHYPAHIAFLVMILIILVFINIGRIDTLAASIIK